MKKLFVFMICAVALCACNDDEYEFGVDCENLLVGQWVYDNPKEKVCKTMKFTSSQKLYYSDSNNILYNSENDIFNGNYTVNGISVTGTYTLNESIHKNLDMQIVKINNQEFTAKFNDTELTYTYARVLYSETIENEETVSPDYSNLLRNIEIIGYSSHNPNIAQVDAKTGKVTGVASGRTYIDVITSEGTAVVEIIVKGILPCKFDDFIGADKSKIYETFGANSTDKEGNIIIYQNVSNGIKTIEFKFDLLTGKVSDIVLKITADNSGYIDNISQYLEMLYIVYAKETTNSYKSYIDNEDFDKATVRINWDTENMLLSYVSLTHDLFTDYSSLLGKKQNEVKSIMKNYELSMKDVNQWAFKIRDGKIDEVYCCYNLDSVNSNETVESVITKLNSGLKTDEVHAYLANKYNYSENENSNTEKLYLSNDGLIAISYSIEYAKVSYCSNVTE